MGYYLRTKTGLKGPVEPDTLRKLVDAGKIRMETTIVDADGESLPVSRALGGNEAPPEPELDLSALDAVDEVPPPVPEVAAPPPVPPAPAAPAAPSAPRRTAPKRSTGKGVPRTTRGRAAAGRTRGKPSAHGARGTGRGRAGSAIGGVAHKLGWATTSLRILMVLYILIGVVIAGAGIMAGQEASATGQDGGGFLAAFGLVMGIISAVIGFLCGLVAKGIDQRKGWAWGAAIVIAILCIPSFFLPIGIFLLLGLIDRGSKAQFA